MAIGQSSCITSILYIQVQVLPYLVISVFGEPNHVHFKDLYIDQGQGIGLDSRDRTLTEAGINILNNLLQFN